NIKNVTSATQTYTLTLTKSSRTPADWTASVVLPSEVNGGKNEIQADEISIPAGQTKTVTVKLTPVSTGAGDVEMVVAVKNNATAMKNTVTISGFSSDISNFQVLDDEESGAYSLDAIISRVGKPKYVSLTPGDYAAVGSQLPNLKTMIWNCGDKGGFTATEASSIKSFFDSGKPVLILGTFVGSTIPTVTPNLNYSFGVSPRGWCRQGQATQGNITLVGYPNDPITNGMDFGSSVIYYFHSGIQCNNPKTYPILRFKTVDTCVAFRTELPSGRVVFLGLNIKQIKLQSVQDALIKNSLNWLEGVGPKVSTTTPSIDFGDVVNNTTKDIDIPLTNDGTEDLVITSASVKDYTSIYAVTTSLPLTITPGQTSNLTLRFSPNFESPFPETLEIKSNAVNNSVLLITVNGKGVASNGPIIATDKSTIQFAKVAINNTKDMNLQISNTGSTDLTISEMSIPSQYSDAFTLKDVTLPLNIAAKAKQTVTFTFSPKEIRLYNNVPVTIKSNSISNATMTVYLQGEGTEPSSVYDGIAGDAQFNITASPNPFADKINIKITIGEKITNSISLVIIDATGREIEHLLNQTLSEGQHSVMFNGSNLSNGVYFIIAKTGDKSVKLPVVLNR
ncbi:MAG: choice-of-anchor D domain-containing protein, partial [Bacteroidota bacterium]